MAGTSFAIIGHGNIGERHARIIRQMDRAELAAVVDTDETKRQQVEAEYNVPFYSSFEAFLKQDNDAEVINICTPNGYHFEQAYAGLDNDCHVLVEKPITLSRQSCTALIKHSESVRKKVFCVLQNRYSPPARWLKHIVDQGLLGKIFLVDINCYWNRDERYYNQSSWRGTKALDGGTLYTQFSHFIDLLIWVFGDVHSSSGQFFNFSHQSNIEFEDSGILNLTLQKSAKVTFTYSTSVWDKNMESSISVIGEKGSLKIGGQYMDKVEYCHVQNYEKPEIPAVNPPNDYGQFKGSAANHYFVFDNLVKALNNEPYELAGPYDACQSIALIEKLYADRNF